MSCTKEKCSVCSWGPTISVAQIVAIYALGRHGVDLGMCEDCERSFLVGMRAVRKKWPKSRLKRMIEEATCRR